MSKNGTVAYITTPKLCDFHKRAAENQIREHHLSRGMPTYEEVMAEVPEATHDVKTRHGFWANVCDDCRAEHALWPNELGVGRGQRLEVRPL